MNKNKVTRLYKFLQMYPHADLTLVNEKEVVNISPCVLDTRIGGSGFCGKFSECTDCREAYWNGVEETSKAQELDENVKAINELKKSIEKLRSDIEQMKGGENE